MGIVSNRVLTEAFASIPNRFMSASRDMFREMLDSYINEIVMESAHLAGPTANITKKILGKAIENIDLVKVERKPKHPKYKSHSHVISEKRDVRNYIGR